MISCMTWLVPAAGPVREGLAGVITRLAAEHGGPVFVPHVTMNGSVDAEPDAAARVLERVVAGVPPFEVTMSGFGHEPVFFRSLYLRAEPSAILTALHEAGQRAWGLDGPPYRPHLSLLYARDLPEERKPAIAGGLGLALPVTIRVDAAEIWGDFRDEVTQWHRVARVPLAG
jgi:2'-5' RNA ligase superfamily